MAAFASPEMPRQQAEELLQAVLKQALDFAYGDHTKTVSVGDPDLIASMLPAALPRSGQGSQGLTELLGGAAMGHIRDYRHPLHFGHQRPAPLVASWAGDLIAGSTNSTVSAFDAGPLSVTVERRVNDWIKELFSLPASARVTQTNGGSESALTGLLCARERWQCSTADPNLDRAVVLHSVHAHYCVARGARVIGLPRENIRAIDTDWNGRMSIPALEAAIADAQSEGRQVIAVVASAGTTANGAFDDLVACAGLARRVGAWFHVDASHGGAAILSHQHAGMLQGLAQADSFGWNPHKLMWISPPSAVFVVRDQAELWQALSGELAQASYIADQKALERTGPKDPVEWSLACTRPFSAIKVFAAFLAYGSDAIGARVDRMVALARRLADQINDKPEFELLCQPDFNIVCFRLAEEDPDSRMHRALRDRLAAGERAYLTGVEMHGLYWLRAHLISENTTEAALEQLLEVVLETRSAMQSPSPQLQAKDSSQNADRNPGRQQRTFGRLVDGV